MPRLTPAEGERLIKLNEELAEASERVGALLQAMGKAGQTISKILLHGHEASFMGVEYNNREDLERELGDVKAAMRLMINAGDLSAERIEAQATAKLPKITRYMQHQFNQEQS